jgi:hypothetical protein
MRYPQANRPFLFSGGSSTSKYNATNVLNVVVPATATKAPHNKISEADHPAPAKVTTPQPATTAGKIGRPAKRRHLKGSYLPIGKILGSQAALKHPLSWNFT